MKNVVLLNGSPRVNCSTSMRFLGLIQNRMGADFNTTVIQASKSILQQNQLQDYARMEQADAIVIAFPLYVYCMPGALENFLSSYREYRSKTKDSVEQKIYAIINCGFPESYICDDAALVIGRFCKEIHASHRFSVLIGCGAMLQPLKMMPDVHKMWKEINTALDRIICDVRDEIDSADIHIDSKMPKWFYYFISQTYFNVIAKKSGITKKGLFRKPYQEKEQI